MLAYSRFLSLKCTVTSGEIPEGAFVFVNYQVIDQNTVITRRLELDSPPEATSQQIREEVRQRLKRGFAHAGRGSEMEKDFRGLLGSWLHWRATVPTLALPDTSPTSADSHRPRSQDRPRR